MTPADFSNSSTVSCEQCGLPVLGAHPGGSSRHDRFCCYGCYLTNSITGSHGEEGHATIFLARLAVAAFLAMNAMVFSWALYGDELPFLFPVEPSVRLTLTYLILVLALPVFFLIGLPYVKNAIAEIIERRPGIDTLIAIGTVSAYLYSIAAILQGAQTTYFDTASMILVLVTFGRYLEATAKLKSHDALRNLTGHQPSRARVIVDGKECDVDAHSIVPGMLIRILPGDIIPVDGVVREGESSVNEALLTGESRPVRKQSGDHALGGSSNYDGSLLLEATSDASSMSLAQIARIVAKVQTERSPSQAIADRVSGYFTSLVLMVALATLAFWWLSLGVGPGMMHMLAVLLIACPCALGIGANLALSIGYTRAATNGVLTRSFSVLERIGRSETVIFDKTGTLTEGHARVVEFISLEEGGVDRLRAIRLAASVETRSEHPFGRAIISYWKSLSNLELYPLSEWKARIGLGVEGSVSAEDGSIVRVSVLSTPSDSSMRLQASGLSGDESRSYLIVDHKLVGVFLFEDSTRESAVAAMAKLKSVVTSTMILSGDKEEAVRSISEKLGMTSFRANLSSEDKIAAIIRLKTEGACVTMVGDGINDSPALAAADVGIALRAGTELSRQASEVIILDDDLGKIPWIIMFSRRILNIVRWNLVWAFAYNIVGIGLAAGGVLSPVLAALAMVASSTMVIVNSSRLSRQGYTTQ